MRKMMYALLAVATTTAIACKKSDTEPEKKKATVVLVHGAWQGPYTWVPVVNKLQQQGYTVVNVELLAHGKDQTAAAGLTMNRYRDQVLATINAQPADQVVLVGHSLGELLFQRSPKPPLPRLPS
ncbi:alpha/beta fold hydrolase [Hymenobacter volaticus]|uniref:Alpha/beta fold hydrolase n=1 Tax=Hymenobacter volaticus TaxID=2932254 RepID=A0ABY4GDD5_9BACT|nr:alpha/beta fold hydrolase [Hymenobacter volaticus]UOQ68938.1 alpha/beta fold hydrolase [Hymenobacter volaticus]